MIARRSVSLALVWLCAAAGALVWCSAPALGQRLHEFSKSFGSAGSGDGQLMRPGELAVNEETGEVYVTDRGNGRVEIFSSTGAYVGQFNGSAAPTGAFFWPAIVSFNIAPEGAIAVDNSKNPLDLSKGDVYVVDTGHGVIDKFTPSGMYIGQLTGISPGSPFPASQSDGITPGINGVAVDPSGALWVQTSLNGGGYESIYQFGDALINEYVSAITPRFPQASDGHGGVVSTGVPAEIGLAFDSEGSFYLGQRLEIFHKLTVPAKFDETGELLAEKLDDEETTGLAVDLSSNDAYFDNETSVVAFGPSGSSIERFGVGTLNASEGIAVDASTGTVYTSDASSQEIDAFTAFVVPDATTGATSNLAETSVTVNGVANADGLPVTSCEFEYGTSESYGQSTPCSPNPGSGDSPVAVSAELKGLKPLTKYHYRLKVSNANGSNEGRDSTFVTPEPVGISEESVSDVSAASALFSAQVDPGGADTTYEFEYGTSTSYGESLPAPAGDLGAGTSGALASVRAQGLSPETTYHVRIVATNVLGTVYGPDETFTTQAGGGAFALPDGREWEMVSPPAKYGASIEPLGAKGVVQASADGGAISYVASGPVVANPAGNPSPLEPTQVLSRHGTGGWSSEDIATQHNEVTGTHYETEYGMFSSDLSLALVEPRGATPLSPEATGETPYVRDDIDGGYVPLVSAGDVPPGTEFGGGGEHRVDAIVGTPDLSHVILTSEGALLTSNAQPEAPNIYEWSGGQLQLVSILPGPGEEAAKGGSLGEDWTDIRNAISDDGSRVFWSEKSSGEGPLYMRDTVTAQTVQVDAPAPGVSPPPRYDPYFQLANADGSKVFFLENEPLTLNSKLPPTEYGNTPSDLYVYDTETGTLTDLSVDANAGELAEVQNMVLGASEDGSVVYFVATGVLGNGAESGAESGKDNLYVESETGSTWSTRFIAVLSKEDSNDWGLTHGGIGNNPGQNTSRVSPNGHYLAFMSQRSLTGYDNRDANSGQPDEEVFLYDEVTGRLRCASCDPTGARPDGLLVAHERERLVDPEGLWEGHWLAASIPGWTQSNNPGRRAAAVYQSRYLSNEGRLFFDSADGLVPEDTNGEEDVYEYEPQGVGSCAHGNGCASLISSGTSPEESAFMDASESGNDVFFLTAARLTPQDVDTSFDVYDAHVCSESEPCVSQPVLPPPCTSGDACKAAPLLQPAIFGAPASATFSGSGNVVSSIVVGPSTPKTAAPKRAKKSKRKRSGNKPKRKRRGKAGGSRARKSLSVRTRR
jgi:sugar lactone lactonase YvrE